MKDPNTPAPEPTEQETSPEVFELLNNFLDDFHPVSQVEHATRTYTTKEIIAAIKDFNSDLYIKDSDVVEYLKGKGYHYKMLPDNFAFKFHWLFAE